MAAVHQASRTAPADHSRAVLDFLHGLLAQSDTPSPSLTELLHNLAGAFVAAGAGLVEFADGATFRERLPETATPPALPWVERPDLLSKVSASTTGMVVRSADVPFLCVPVCPREGAAWMLWLEGKAGQSWTAAESAALTLAAGVLARWLGPEPTRNNAPAWALQLEQAARQRRLEDIALVTRRLAHDYGNVLTSILGFTELSLAQLPGDSPLKRYLGEVHRGCQQGSLLTQRLRLFARRPPSAASPPTPLAVALAEHKARSVDWASDVELILDVPDDLPPVALGGDQLYEVLSALLDNAAEAIEGEGRVTLTARTADLTRDECLLLWGNPAPGPVVRVDISDTGPGLSPDARARLFREPFFTNKPRHRGLGLAIVYGILHSQKGGFCLEDSPGTGKGRGVTARVYLPAAAVETPAIPAGQSVKESILVVDDDPQVLHMVSEALRRVGYRVQTATSAAEALALCTPSRGQSTVPFELIVSDVVMPQTTGVELARRLLSRDDRVRLLFMSGMVGTETLRRDLADLGDLGDLGRDVGLLPKPFPVETLLRAVRTALASPPPVAAATAATATSEQAQRRSLSPVAATSSEPSTMPAVRPSTSRSMQR
jgi:signal transduction histidine kinase/CheY-like chemotaxis protein